MARAHEIGIAADTKAFDRGIRDGVIEPLEDAEKALDDLADAAQDAGQGAARGLDKIGDAAEDAGRESARGLDKLEDALKDAQDASEKAERAVKDFGEAGKKAGKTASDGIERAEEGLDEFKDEAQSTAKEAAASFDGSFESIGEVAQEVAANAFSGFGPAGTAAGIAVAAGAGVIIDNITKVGEAFDEAKEAAFEMAYGVGGALEAAGYAQRIEEWTSDTEKWKQVMDLAAASGWDEVDVIDALASGGPKIDKLTEAFSANAVESQVTSGRLNELDAVLKATEEGYAAGSAAAEANSRALYDYTQQVGTATGETDELGNAIYRLPDGTEVVVDAKTREASNNIDQFEQNVQGMKDKTITARVKANTGGATAAINDWVSRNNGKTVTVYAKTVGRLGTKNYP